METMGYAGDGFCWRQAQTECGVIFEDIIKKRTREGNRLIIFGPLAVTSELPHWSPQKIRSRVKEVIEIAKDNANLVFFTSSSLGVRTQQAVLGAEVYYDATNSKAREYVWQKIKQNYGSYGIHMFWLDEAEFWYSQSEL